MIVTASKSSDKIKIWRYSTGVLLTTLSGHFGKIVGVTILKDLN